jgi:hypothetical protein
MYLIEKHPINVTESASLQNKSQNQMMADSCIYIDARIRHPGRRMVATVLHVQEKNFY